MKKPLIVSLLALILAIPLVNAFCPVCTIAVAVGVGFFREWGIDDVLTGLWYGALIVSSIGWFISWLNKKNIHFLFRKILVIIVFYALFIWPLYPLNIMGIAGNTFLGMDRMLFGTIVGSVVFVLSKLGDNYLRKVNEGHLVMPYQKVFVPLIFTILATIIMYLVLRIVG